MIDLLRNLDKPINSHCQCCFVSLEICFRLILERDILKMCCLSILKEIMSEETACASDHVSKSSFLLRETAIDWDTYQWIADLKSISLISRLPVSFCWSECNTTVSSIVNINRLGRHNYPFNFDKTLFEHPVHSI